MWLIPPSGDEVQRLLTLRWVTPLYVISLYHNPSCLFSHSLCQTSLSFSLFLLSLLWSVSLFLSLSPPLPIFSLPSSLCGVGVWSVCQSVSLRPGFGLGSMFNTLYLNLSSASVAECCWKKAHKPWQFETHTGPDRLVQQKMWKVRGDGVWECWSIFSQGSDWLSQRWRFYSAGEFFKIGTLDRQSIK